MVNQPFIQNKDKDPLLKTPTESQLVSCDGEPLDWSGFCCSMV
ncbi:hypothetical protein LINPERHAP1_LOCUS21430 [Linum perenne]